MTSPSISRLVRPSSFALRSALRRQQQTTSILHRSYATGSGEDIGPNKTHTTDKKPSDVQSAASQKGQQDRAEGTGGNATSGSDTGGHNAQAKKDHPEAPGPVIGMNDERGGKGS